MTPEQTLPLYLKTATADRHQQLDAKVSLDFTAPEVAIKANYGRLLLATYRFVGCIEKPLNDYLEKHAPAPWEHRADRLPALQKDLAGLSLALPAPEPAMAFTSLAQALGFLYVLEGSALGGRVLYKQLRDVDAIAQCCDFAYHGVPAETLGSRWKTILQCLTMWLPVEAFATAGEGAKAAFAHFETCLGQSGETEQRHAPTY